MPSDFSFRLSMYLSLALACGCLGYAEADLLPTGAVLAVLTIALLAVAFRTEGRFELSLAAANQVGVVLFVGGAVWLVMQFANRKSLLYTVPLPASLLPYIGTVLMVAVPAKLLRPKHAGDWWALQGMGLAAVMLACALAEDGPFGVLLALYAVTAVGGLGLFYLKREAGQVPPAARDPLLVGGVEWLTGFKFHTPPAAPPAVVASAPARVRAAWRPAVGWLAVAAAVALPLFFLTPRSNAPRWSMTGVSLETGYDSPQMTDLTRTGDLRVNTEAAFEVSVTDAAGLPYPELNLNQRWRGVSFVKYESGQWRGVALEAVIDPQSMAVSDQIIPRQPQPEVRPGMLRATYAPRSKTSDPPLADPVRWEAGGGSPVWSFGRSGAGGSALPWIQKRDGAFNARFAVPGVNEGYVQYLYPSAVGEPDLGTAFDPEPPTDPVRTHLGALAGGAVLFPHPLAGTAPAVKLRELPAKLNELPARTRQLLDEMVAAGKLSARVTQSAGYRRDSRVEPDDWEAVAETFCTHLSAGGYEYTLKLRRQSRDSDPIEDFLYHTRAGNCERFAAGLVLMCRAVGVPARYVLGFKGHEPLGDGKYLVRQDHAHAWAEVLIARRTPTPAGFRWHWLTLDPTPDGDDGESPTSLLGTAARGGKSFFTDYIVGYNAERRRQAAVEVGQTVTSRPFQLVAAAVGGTLFSVWLTWRLVRAWRRRATAPVLADGWYDRLVRALVAAGHPVLPGQTPAEYAHAVGQRLAAGPQTHELAGLPQELTDLFYRERFGGVPPTADVLSHIEAALGRIAAELPATTPAR